VHYLTAMGKNGHRIRKQAGILRGSPGFAMYWKRIKIILRDPYILMDQRYGLFSAQMLWKYSTLIKVKAIKSLTPKQLPTHVNFRDMASRRRADKASPAAGRRLQPLTPRWWGGTLRANFFQHSPAWRRQECGLYCYSGSTIRPNEFCSYVLRFHSENQPDPQNA